ncbi:caveolae-associated protein 2 [Gastrophryne carolinensis]
MEKDLFQVVKNNEEIEKSSEHESQELVVPNHSPAESPNSSPTLHQQIDTFKDGNQVNAITVLTLLNKLENMLDSVQENQNKMEKRQIDIENSVKVIQNEINKFWKNHTSTSNTVSQLLKKSRKVSVNMKDIKDRMDKQNEQVKKLESNHDQLLKRNNFKVLIFQEENEIPANLFVKESPFIPCIAVCNEETSDPNKSQKETMHTIDLSSEDEVGHEDYGNDHSSDEKFEPTRAAKMKRSSLKKVDSLKKAFSRQNIEKKMSKIGTKIVSPERREKIKKSFTPSHNKPNVSSIKIPIGFSVKKTHDGETCVGSEEKMSANKPSEMDENSTKKVADDIKMEDENTINDSTDREEKNEKVVTKNIELSIIEDKDENEGDFESVNPFSSDYKPKPEELEDSLDSPNESATPEIDHA